MSIVRGVDCRMNWNPPKIVCVVGRSGSGKDFLVERLERTGLDRVISYTTRPPRYPGEGGHHFVTKEEFDAIRDKMIAYTVFDDHEYGATEQDLNGKRLYIIDPSGVEYMTNKIGRENFKVVYIDCNEQVAFERMKESRSLEEALRRLEHDRSIYANFTDYDIALRNETEMEASINVSVLIRFLELWFHGNYVVGGI
jgi:guanylate kinase